MCALSNPSCLHLCFQINLDERVINSGGKSYIKGIRKKKREKTESIFDRM
jgi:hypothetical protein